MIFGVQNLTFCQNYDKNDVSLMIFGFTLMIFGVYQSFFVLTLKVSGVYQEALFQG